MYIYLQHACLQKGKAASNATTKLHLMP